MSLSKSSGIVELSFVSKVLRWASLVLLALLLVIAGLKVYLDSTYFSDVLEAGPVAVSEVTLEAQSDRQIRRFRFPGFDGQTVPAVLAMPARRESPLPCIVFLHGIMDHKDSLDFGDVTGTVLAQGYALASFDQATCGERKLPKGASPLALLAAFRTRAAANVLESRRLLDYLTTLPEIDPQRIYFCGASFGVISGTCAAAMDARYKAVALIYGGGDLYTLPSATYVRQQLGGWLWPAQWTSWYLGSAFDPLRFVGQIAPRPVFIGNGKADRIIAHASAEALHTAALEPRELRWYEGDHMGTPESGGNVPLQKQVFTDLCQFFTRAATPSSRAAVVP